MGFMLSALAAAVQMFVVGALVLVIASRRAGVAARSLMLFGVATLCGGIGFVVASQQPDGGVQWLLALGNSWIALSHLLMFIAVRMLLGVKQYRWIAGTVATITALAQVLDILDPSTDPSRTVLPNVLSLTDGLALGWAVLPRLRGTKSTGARIWLGTMLFISFINAVGVVSEAWPNFALHMPAVILAFSSITPTLSGIAFLVMYNEIIQEKRAHPASP
jgi:hypothetical protein